MKAEFQTFSELKLHNLEVVHKQVDEVYTLPSDIDKKIELVWNNLKKNQPKLHASPLYRVIDTEKNKNSFRINVSTDFSYKEVVGLRNIDKFNTYFLDLNIPYVLSMIALVYTKDKQLILIERDSGDWPKSLELPGAFMRPSLGTALYPQALRFMEGDIGITEEDIFDHQVLGILPYDDICEKMLVVSFFLKLSLEEIKKKCVKKIHVMPSNYTSDSHLDFFDLPLHIPSRTIIKKVIESSQSVSDLIKE